MLIEAQMMNINYKGVYLSAVSCARQMVKYDTPGSMVLVGSMSGVIANKQLFCSVYNSSKAAVIQLGRSLAMEWKDVVNGRPIRVNVLCPGNTMTPVRLFPRDHVGSVALTNENRWSARISKMSRI